MNLNNKYFKNSKSLPLDQFFEEVLYNKKYGYYSQKLPFGVKGDFITAPLITFLFSEMIAVWIISCWEKLNKPKNFNIVELGPGDGMLTKKIYNTLKKFPEFFDSSSFFLYEKSNYLKKIQKKNIKEKDVKWIKNFSQIKKGPTFFIGNEFLDAIPVKQFIKKNQSIFEKYVYLNKNKTITEIFKKAKIDDIKNLKKFKTLKELNFIEFPKLGLAELNKIVKELKKRSAGGILLIDYGYLKQINTSTLQSLKSHKKNDIFHNLGRADVTSLVNFKLLKEYFLYKKLKVKNIVTQSFFLKKIGIIERANNVSKKMSFKEKSDLYLRLNRLLDPRLMGELFKVAFAYKGERDKFIGFN